MFQKKEINQLITISIPKNIVPDFARCPTNNIKSLFTRRRGCDNSIVSITFDNINPKADSTTCFTTCVWLSHADISVDSKINPLTPCVVQSPSKAQLKYRCSSLLSHDERFTVCDYNMGFIQRTVHWRSTGISGYVACC